jgi:hypothetical protein
MKLEEDKCLFCEDTYTADEITELKEAVQYGLLHSQCKLGQG